MRKLRYVSDLHLEINHMFDVPEWIVGCEGEDIILAGDSIVAYILDATMTSDGALKLQASFKKLALQVMGFDRVFLLMGNHEHYNGHFQDSKKLMQDFLYDKCGLSPEKYIILDNDVVELDDHTVLLGATLWTDMRKDNDDAHYFVSRGMNDFKLISYGNPNTRFTTADAVLEHKATLAFFREQLEKYKDKRVIVATHHTPSYQSEGRYYAGSTITDGYCSDLSEFILDHPQITDWIHGHTHVNAEYMIGKCRVTTNMRGYYIDDALYKQFDAKSFQEKVIEY